MSASFKSSRRGFLGAVTAALGGAASASFSPAAAEPFPSAAPAPASPAALDARLREMIAERDAAAAARQAARSRFYELCPPRPLELIAPPTPPEQYRSYAALEFNLGPELQNRGPGSTSRLVYDAAKMGEDVHLYPPSTPHGRWLAKRIASARRFDDVAAEIAVKVGYPRAEARETAAGREIEALCRYMLAIEPRTLADLQAHARVISATAEQRPEGLWINDPALKLMAALLRLTA
jgi:hypothetical protein